MKSRNRLSVRLKDLPREDRPRERLMQLGPESLSNRELIAAILGTGNKEETVLDIARRVLSKYGVRDLSHVTVSELKGTFGISDAKACRLVASVELGKRIVIGKTERKLIIEGASDIAGVLMPRLKGLKKEVLRCFCLDSKLHPLKESIISTGGLNTNSILISDVFRTAISEAAAAIILVHNHPSGDPKPSKKDISVTKRLVRAGKLIDIEVLDHIIIGDDCYVSLRELELL